MISNYFKIFSIVIIFIFPNEAKSKNNYIDEFNSRELSSYLSAIIALNNEKNEISLEYFKSSKNLKNIHNQYFKKYITSLALNQNVKGAIQELKIQKDKKKIDFYEAYLLLAIDSIQKKDFKKSSFYLRKLSKYQNVGTFENIIFESLKNYFYAFENKKIIKQKSNYKNLDNLNLTFIKCYLSHSQTKQSFEKLINSSTIDYSRYLFFYISHLIENKNFSKIKNITKNIDDFNSTLLVLQTKIWIEKNQFENISKIFSCKNEEDILAEFFFLTANLYSNDNNFQKSNFYLSVSNHLNKKFKYNLSLIADNYFESENFNHVKKILKKFDSNDGVFYWYKVKKLSSIIANKHNDKQALKYLENKYSKINDKNNKIIFDMANIYRNYKKYDEAIKLYTTIMENVLPDTVTFADLLYRRGGSYERLGKFKKSDEDLQSALKILPDNSNILNYLAYSWLERDINISKSVSMLELAYEKDDKSPYIIDSIGWAYYLINRFEEAEVLLRKAIILMPNDPIVNDHYGDILWSLNRKIEAKYYWNSVLNFKNTDEEMKKKIKNKLLLGTSKKNENL